MAGHWAEYAIEGLLLAAFMLAACAGACLLEHPASFVRQRIASSSLRRAIMGALMGLTAVALIYSPAGRRSGAHMNPAVTLAFYSLGKIGPRDACFYVLGQFAGGWLGALTAAVALRRWVAHATVGFVATTPGRRGARGAWAGEFAVSFVMMSTVLATASVMDVAPYTGLFAGAILAGAIAFESPLSGTSLNPARSLASAIAARRFCGLWVYFTAPPVGMLLAAALHAGVPGAASPCAKLCHDRGPCIFGCDASASPASAPGIRYGGAGAERSAKP